MNYQDLIDKLETLNRKVDALTESLQNKQSAENRWLRTDEACAYLSISSSQLQVLKNDGVLPVKKLGGTNYYDRIVIDRMLEENSCGVSI